MHGIHADWREAQGNYDEFRFFTGLRPSEQIALTVHDFDPECGTLSITKARVNGVHKISTKTGHDRLFEVCPRALAVLARHLKLRDRLVAEGRITHDHSRDVAVSGRFKARLRSFGASDSCSYAELPGEHHAGYRA